MSHKPSCISHHTEENETIHRLRQRDFLRAELFNLGIEKDTRHVIKDMLCANDEMVNIREDSKLLELARQQDRELHKVRSFAEKLNLLKQNRHFKTVDYKNECEDTPDDVPEIGLSDECCDPKVVVIKK